MCSKTATDGHKLCIHVCRDIDRERGREKERGEGEREKQTFVHGMSLVPLVLSKLYGFARRTDVSIYWPAQPVGTVDV